MKFWRLIIIIGALCLCAIPLHAQTPCPDSDAFCVDTCTATGTSPLTCTFAGGTHLNDVMVFYGQNTTTGTAMTFSGCGTVTGNWTIATQTTTQHTSRAYASATANGSCGITCTASTNISTVVGLLLRGVNTTPDKLGTLTSGSSAPAFTTPSITTVTDGDFVIAMVLDRAGSSHTFTWTAPFALAKASSTADWPISVSDNVQTSHGAISASGTENSAATIKTDTIAWSPLVVAALPGFPIPTAGPSWALSVIPIIDFLFRAGFGAIAMLAFFSIVLVNWQSLKQFGSKLKQFGIRLVRRKKHIRANDPLLTAMESDRALTKQREREAVTIRRRGQDEHPANRRST